MAVGASHPSRPPLRLLRPLWYSWTSRSRLIPRRSGSFDGTRFAPSLPRRRRARHRAHGAGQSGPPRCRCRRPGHLDHPVPVQPSVPQPPAPAGARSCLRRDREVRHPLKDFGDGQGGTPTRGAKKGDGRGERAGRLLRDITQGRTVRDLAKSYGAAEPAGATTAPGRRSLRWSCWNGWRSAGSATTEAALNCLPGPGGCTPLPARRKRARDRRRRRFRRAANGSSRCGRPSGSPRRAWPNPRGRCAVCWG